MGNNFVVPEDLLKHFAMLGNAQHNVQDAANYWQELTTELNAAAGTDDDTATQIKAQANQLNPDVPNLISGLTQLFGLTQDKAGKFVQDAAHTDQAGTSLAQKL